VEGFNVTVSCSRTTFSEGGQNYAVFGFTALAEQGIYGNGEYVSRQLSARVTNAAP